MFSPRPFFRPAVLVLFLAASSVSPAAEISAVAGGKKDLKDEQRVAEPHLQPVSDESLKAMKRFALPPGFTAEVWAAEPMLGNPVAFTFDNTGRAFVSETYRYRTSVLDIRHYMFMLEDDLACRTTDDRIASTKRNFPNSWQKLGIETEVVRLLEDRGHTGKADFSAVYADKFNTLLDGISSGVLAHDGKVWVTNIPNLWLLEGIDKDSHATKRESLSSGYGVRFSFTGHDMHGLVMGPDGRLYFSFGDRGANVKTKEGKTIAVPDEGAVFRCEPDGSQMELFCRGLRNPQELAFDNHGNLFTGDNDSDQGDRERWEYLVEGGDYGWRVGWQHNPLGKEHNPWLAEHLWEPRKAGTPFYVLSPIFNLPVCTSGLTHYPGTGLPAQWDDFFFLCGFKGSSARSAIASLKVKESGAGFSAVQEPKTFVGEVQATDVTFGPDSNMYFSEWGEGWEGTGRGRIFKLEHPQAQREQAAQIAEVKKLLGEGFAQRPSDELAKLLAHNDQRVRLEAQWALAAQALAEKDATGSQQISKLLMSIASDGTEGVRRDLARLHAVWGIGQIARGLIRREHPDGDFELPPPPPGAPILCENPDPEVRAQALGVIAQLPGRLSPALAKIVTAKLTDSVPRVRFFAATALANHGDASATAAVVAMLRENADRDEFLRHAGVRALASCDCEALDALAEDASRSVRLGALLAMRRFGSAEIAQFLNDADPLLVKEAARAINDEGIAGGFGALAKLIAHPSSDEQLMLRVINANFRAGGAANAEALAKYATSENAAESLRVEALKALATWPKPPARDRIVGIFRPLAERDAQPAIAALKSAFPNLLDADPPAVMAAALDAVAALGMQETGPTIFLLVANPRVPAKARAQALTTLAAFNDPVLSDAIKIALISKDAALRVQASAMLAKLNPDEAAQQLASAFSNSGIAEKKSVISALGDINSAAADRAIGDLFDEFIAGKLPAEVRLELLEAAGKRHAPEMKKKLAAYQASLPPGDLLAAFAPALAGGDRDSGEKIFKEHVVAQCFRCHKINGVGGDAGPELTGIGAKKDRKYILESILNPNAQIAEGFQSILVTLKNGEMQMGIVKAETGDELTLQTFVPGAAPAKVKKSDVKSREAGPSGMPPGFDQLLTKREIRDIVEFVASLK